MGIVTERDRERAIKEDATTDGVLDRDMRRRLSREKRLDKEDRLEEEKQIKVERERQSKEEGEKLESESLDREKLDREKLEREGLQNERHEHESLDREKLDRENLERENLGRENIESERVANEGDQMEVDEVMDNVERGSDASFVQSGTPRVSINIKSSVSQDSTTPSTVQKLTFVPKVTTTTAQKVATGPVVTAPTIFQAFDINGNSTNTSTQSIPNGTSGISGTTSTNGIASVVSNGTNLDSRAIMSRVPKSIEEVFGYSIDWGLVESCDILNVKMRPWIRRRMAGYMGEDDDRLVGQVVEYVLSRIAEHKTPSLLLKDVERFLDREAVPFVLGLWRLLIFEILSNKYSRGLSNYF